MSEVRIKGFKGFGKDLKCKDFQFKIGETYKYTGPVKVCQSGFHFCENPLDILSYYDPANSVFAEVEGSGSTETHADDSK
ncbi:MAG: hypothetical protein U1E51_17680, partial [Candidatus Binatia bacterium]|nr:hypothetical protein [Candidatus Binatia bacterium]